MPTAGPDIADALYTLAQDVFEGAPETGVYYGHPGLERPDNIISVMGDVESTQELAPVGPLRKREEFLTLHVTISAFMGGTGSELQKAVTEHAFALLQSLEAGVQADPTLGITPPDRCRALALTGYQKVEAAAKNKNTGTVTGRITEIAAEFTTAARIYST